MTRYPFVLFALAAVSLYADKPPADAKPEDPSVTFRSDVALARVDVQVVDRENRPITGLRAQDFILRADGKQQEIGYFLSEKAPVDLMLLLDVSRSMKPHVERIAAAAHQALGVLGDQDRIAILVFDRVTRLRLPFQNNRRTAERELEMVVDRETFTGGTDITRGLLDAASYMARNARRDARRAIVILTDDQTERDRNEAAVSRALTRADCVLSALIAPDALHTGSADRMPLEELWRGLMGPGGPAGPMPRMLGPRTRSAGSAGIARQSGGDSMAVEEASAFENTLARIRERYALYFYLPEGETRGERAIEIELSDAARRRYPGAEVRYKRSYTGSRDKDKEDAGPTWVSLPGPRAA